MTRLCTTAVVALSLVALATGSALAVPNPTGDTYTYTSTNMPGDDGPINVTFDGIAENVGSSTLNEHYWDWPGGVISGETYDIRAGDVDPQHYTDVLPDWANAGSILEFDVQNNTPGGGLVNNGFITQTVAIDGIDLNNGPAVPTILTNAFYFYFTSGGNPIPFKTGTLYYDTDIWVGEHPINPGQEVYYVDFAQSDIDSGLIINLHSGGLDVNYDIEREFGQPGANFNILEYVLALAADPQFGDPNIDGVGFGYLIQQAPPGDGNGDGWVDGLDYLLWAGNFGTHPGPDGDISDGDYNDDGWIDGLDYLLWASNYGSHYTPPVSTAVPEPGMLTLVGLALSSVLFARRRR